MSPLRLIAAFVVAPAVPAAAFCAQGLFLGATMASLALPFIFAATVTYAHAVILGIPTALLLAKLHRLTLLHVLVAAFLIGALPFAAWNVYNEITMPSGSGASFNGVPHRIDGRLTSAGLSSILEGILMTGFFGMIAGAVWWWMSGASANNALQPTRERAAERGR